MRGLLVKRLPVLVAFALVAAIALSSCGRPAEVPSDPVAEDTKEGGMLVIGMAWEPDPVLDPYQLGWGNLPLDMFEGLLAVDWEFEPGPGIAESWSFEEQGRVQVYKIRQDKYFHDGTPINAETLKLYFEYLLSEDVDAPGRYDFAFISSMEVVDEFTLKLILDNPYPAALYNFGWGGGWGGIQNAEAWLEHGPWGTNQYGTSVVVGTGPFKFVEWIPGDKIVLERFDEYKSPPIFGNPGPAYLDGVIYRYLPDSATRVIEFEVGNVHILEDVPPEYVDRVKGIPGATLLMQQSWEVVYVGMATDKEPFNDVRVRHAINLAINQEELVDVVWMGMADPAYSYISPKFGDAYVADKKTFGFDPEAAKALLTEAGYADGFSAVLAVEHRTDWVAAAEVIQDMLADVGITVDILQYDRAGFYEHLRLGEQDLFIRAHSWYGLDILPWYFHSRYYPYPNYHRYVDEDLDTMFDEAEYSETFDLMISRYKEMQKHLGELALWAPLVHPYDRIAVRPEVQSFRYHPMYGVRYNVDTWLKK